MYVAAPRTDTGSDHGSPARRRLPWRLPAAVLSALLAASVVSGTSAAAAGPGSGGNSASTTAPSVQKPVPVAPANTATDTPRGTPKPKLAEYAGKPLLAWSVTLTASRSVLWPTEYTTLTATANQDLGPTPYYLSIFDDIGGPPLISCSKGTTCSRSITQPTKTSRDYIAIVSSLPTSLSSVTNIQARSNYQTVQWLGMALDLTADQYTTGLGGWVVLTANTSTDVGSTPFNIEIFDATMGIWLNDCNSGTVCHAVARQTVATTHRYVAYVSAQSTSLPPPAVQNTSTPVFVTWSTTGWSISVTKYDTPGDGTQSVTATANGDVGPTPYFIELFDVDSRTRIGVCGSTNVCTVVRPTYGHVVAFVSANDTTLLPANIQANSNTVEVTGPPIG